MKLFNCDFETDSAHPHLPITMEGRKPKGKAQHLKKYYRTTVCPKQGDRLVPFISFCSSLASQFCKTQSLWLWSSEVQRHSFTEVLQPNCMIKSFMTPGKNHTLRFCSLFPRIMHITPLLPLLEHNRNTHWVSLCLFPQTSSLLKGGLMLLRETSRRHKRCPREIFQPCCSLFPADEPPF